MLELVVSVCLLEDHSRCKDVSLVYMAESMSPMQCMMASPAEIAKWAEGHPKWFAKKWSCRPAGRVAKNLSRTGQRTIAVDREFRGVIAFQKEHSPDEFRRRICKA